MNAPVQAPGQQPELPKGSFWRTVKTVAWSFIGIRKNSEFKEDLGRVNPFHVIAVGIIGVALFVVGLILLVNWIVAK